MTTIALRTPLLRRLRTALALAYLRWRLSDIEGQAQYEASDTHPNEEQIAVFRRCAQAVRVRIATLENS